MENPNESIKEIQGRLGKVSEVIKKNVEDLGKLDKNNGNLQLLFKTLHDLLGKINLQIERKGGDFQKKWKRQCSVIDKVKQFEYSLQCEEHEILQKLYLAQEAKLDSQIVIRDLINELTRLDLCYTATLRSIQGSGEKAGNTRIFYVKSGTAFQSKLNLIFLLICLFLTSIIYYLSKE